MEPEDEKQEEAPPVKEVEEGHLKDDAGEDKPEEPIVQDFVEDFQRQREEIRAYERSKVERKRSREKQRRTEVTSGLDALLALMYAVDPRIRNEVEDRATKVDGSRLSGSDASAISRVELISLATQVLERVHQENEERKLVIDRLAKALLAIEEANGHSAGLPPALSRDILPPYSAARDIQFQRQALARQQLELEALTAASLPPSGLPSSLRGGLLPEASVLGQAASLSRSPLAADLALGGGGNPASLLGASSLPPGLTDTDLSLLRAREGLGRGNPDQALYRELLARRRQEEDAVALAAAAGFGGRGPPPRARLLDREDPRLVMSRGGISDRMSPRGQLSSSDNINQNEMCEQTIAQAAAANAARENEDAFPMKRFKGHHA